MPIDVPLNPAEEWFSPPESGIPTNKRITIEPDGRVYGYIALWDTCHAGFNGTCVKPPRGSDSNYEYAHQGETMTASGELIRTAVIAGGINHAPLDADSAFVPEYYENTGTQLMRVRYGEDDHGLWFAGALWPDVDDFQVAHIRASSVSGDWRFHAAFRRSSRGGMDFAGSCFVNLPGFPMPAEGFDNTSAPTNLRLAASAFMPLENDEDILYLISNNIKASGAAMEEENECTGNPEDCGCNGNCANSDADYLAEIEALVERRAAIKAAAETPEMTDVERINALEQVVASLVADNRYLRTWVDQLQADQIMAEIAMADDGPEVY